METEQFLRRFFGDGNRFSYADILERGDVTHEAIRRWIASLTEENQPVVLPRWREDGVTWYGVARTEQQVQHLTEEVKAFVGPSYSTFTGQRASLDRDDAVERAVEEFTDGRAIRFTGNDEAIRAALDRMHSVRDQREPYSREEDLGVGIVLRQFNMALRAGDRPTAEERLGYLRERRLLDTANLSYLVVRMLAAFDEWDELLQRDEIPGLLQQESRPLRVTRALIQAVYNVHLIPYEEEDDPEGAVEHFRSAVLPEYGDLFTVRSSMQAPEVLKTFMMRAVSENDSEGRSRSELLDMAEQTDLIDPFFQALAALGDGEAAGQRTVEHPIRDATAAWAEGRSDEAFRLLRGADSSMRKARLLIPLVGALQSLDVESELAATLTQLNEPERQTLTEESPLCRRLADSGGPPSNWTSWFEQVKEGRLESREQALTYAEKLTEEWQPKHLLEDSGALERFTQAVHDAPLDGKAARIVSHALPTLLRALQNDPDYPRSTFQGLYQAILARIPYADHPIRSDLDVFLDLSEVRLDQGVTDDAYTEIIDGATALWDDCKSARHVDWLLDFAELLVLAPTRDAEAQMRLLTTVVGAIRQYERHVDPVQVELFRRLCEDVDHPEVAAGLNAEVEASGQQDRLCDMLHGSTLGIYTLTENAGRRAKSFLEDRCTGLTVHLRHDKAGSSELHTVAQNADYFVVVTRSATHAATDVIEQHMSMDRLIRPKGKGSSSLLRALQDYADE
jgi:hypothetical protein